MGFNSITFFDRSPASNTVNYDGTETLTCGVGAWGAYLARSRIYYRRNGGTWAYDERSYEQVYEAVHTFVIGVDYSDFIEWYVVGWTYENESNTSDIRTITGGPGTVAPTIIGVSPSAGNVTPRTSGVTFQASVSANYTVAEAKLYVDGALEYTWTTSGTKALAKKLTLGAHTYRWTAKDRVGNTSDTGTVNITVINGAPEVPSGTITVAGETGAVSVANLGAVALSWPAFLDGNPEDSLTYTLENRAAGGAWAELATGLTGLTYEWWAPNIGLGAAELRVKANDGTTDSAYLTRTGITIVSSQSPNAPTLTSPLGGESWREGETHNVTWTPAATEHPEGLPCTYEIQFSALGDFSDAVTITAQADDGTYPWTLATDLV
jgi:hypothetical protein